MGLAYLWAQSCRLHSCSSCRAPTCSNSRRAIGANGVHAYINGQDMPFLAWTRESAANLQPVLAALGINVDLNQLRNFGLGVNLKLPPAQGKPVLDVPRWRGETATTTAEAAPAGAPVSLGISFDEQGRASALGMSPEALSAVAGGAVPNLDANILQMIKRLGWQKLQVQTTPNGITLLVNDNQPLPTLSYDQASLQRLIDVAAPILEPTNPNLLATLQQALPALTTQNLNITVGLNGTPVETKLSDLPIGISDAGAITFGGMPLPGATIPAATLDQLKSAGVESVGVAATNGGILLAVNGQTLPKITYTDQGLNTIANLAGPAAGVPPAMITGGLQAVTNAGLSTSIALPGGQAGPAPTEPTFAPPDLGDVPTPTLRVAATVKDGQITSVGGLSAEQLGALGVTLPTLPPNVNDALKNLGAKQIDIVTEPNKLRVTADGTDVLGMEYDQASLKSAWDLAKPQLADGPLADPGCRS